jgi:aryl-alcohol dehydrogenase-like predicted oxidoreductase
MSYGDPTTAAAHRWTLDDAAAQPFLRPTVELGITFWDTANVCRHPALECWPRNDRPSDHQHRQAFVTVQLQLG